MSEYVIPLTLIVTVFSVLIVVFLFVVVVSISHVRKRTLSVIFACAENAFRCWGIESARACAVIPHWHNVSLVLLVRFIRMPGMLWYSYYVFCYSSSNLSVCPSDQSTD